LRAGDPCRKLARMSEEIRIARDGAVYELRLNRAAKRNAITHSMYEELARALAEARADAAVRAVLLSGEGPGFCAGNDLQDFLSGPEFTLQHPVMRVLRALATFDKPLVAAVQGQAVGIGVTMLLHCDLVLAAQGAQFTLPFVALGLVPEAGSSLLLPRLVGPQRAAELLLLGKPCDAETAARLGWVNRVVSEESLLGEARKVAHALTQQPPAALAATRRLLRGDPAQLLERIDEEARAFGAALKSQEFKDSIRAFLARGRGG
jgi:enoyl-CoA hydratase/carnithine racemase